MKLSDAIFLGSTLLAPQTNKDYREAETRGPFDMAAVAAGYTLQGHDSWEDSTVPAIERVWGWWVLDRMPRPCKCFFLFVPRKMRAKDIITHLFDHHVVSKKNWTLEQLVDWVRKVEPAESAMPRTTRPQLAVVWRRPTPTESWRPRPRPQPEIWRASAERLSRRDFEDVVRMLAAKHGHKPRPKP